MDGGKEEGRKRKGRRIPLRTLGLAVRKFPRQDLTRRLGLLAPVNLTGSGGSGVPVGGPTSRRVSTGPEYLGRSFRWQRPKTQSQTPPGVGSGREDVMGDRATQGPAKTRTRGALHPWNGRVPGPTKVSTLCPLLRRERT